MSPVVFFFILDSLSETYSKQGYFGCIGEVDNIGSKKSIEKNGFISVHQMLLLDF